MNIDFKSAVDFKSPMAPGLGFAALLTPVTALYAPKGIVVLFAIATLICLGTIVSNKQYRPSLPGSLGWSVLALTVWGVASLAWTVSFDSSWPLARSLPLTMIGGIVLILSIKKLGSTDLDFVNRLTIAGFALGAVLAATDFATGMKISLLFNIHKEYVDWNFQMHGFVINNGITLLAMFLWPVCIIFTGLNRGRFAFFALIIAIVITAQGSNFSAVAAIGVGCLSFLLAILARRKIHLILATCATVLILGAPFFMKALPDSRTIGRNLPELSVSVYPRLVIWQYASNWILENPITGYGLRTSRDLNRESEPISFAYRSNGEILEGNTKAIPLHPHNGIIQLWLELGGVGALIGLIFVLSIIRAIHTSWTSQRIKALLYASLMSSICLISVSYGLWQNWWMGALWLQGALITTGIGPRDERELKKTT